PNVSTTTETTKITAGLNDVSLAVADDLGRTSQTQHATPNGTVKVDTTYDSLGRVSSVSNPYFSTSDSTYGVTTNQYDALNRVIRTIKQDGSVSKIKYNVASTIAVNGDCAITTDEAGQQRGHCTDAMGRLVEV